MWRHIRAAGIWLASDNRLAVLALRIRRSLSVKKPLRVEGTQLQFTAESWLELRRSQNVSETWTADWVRSLPESTVLWDVGANIGVFSLLAAENPNVDKVVAIEPAFFNYTSILRNTLLNGLTGKVIVLPVGLGETSALLDFNLQNLKSGGSMHSFDQIFAFKDRSVDPAATFGCLCYRLDDLVAVRGLPFPTHIKIDIDGRESAVLRGGDKVLHDDRVRGLQIEVMDNDESLPRRREITAFIEARGWKLSDTISHPSQALMIADLRFVRPEAD